MSLYNDLKASLMLVERARFWERLALDQSNEREVRVAAALYAKAIRQEMWPA